MNVATKSVSINAPPDRIWDEMTASNAVARDVFGARIESDWRRGGTVVYRGELNGRSFEDRGTILDIDPPLFLRVSYEVSGGGEGTITHALSRDGKLTRLTVTQQFTTATPEAQARAEANWASWLAAIKAMIEGQ